MAAILFMEHRLSLVHYIIYISKIACTRRFFERSILNMSLFAEATKKAASARFKQPQLDAEGQEIEVSCLSCANVYIVHYALAF